MKIWCFRVFYLHLKFKDFINAELLIKSNGLRQGNKGPKKDISYQFLIPQFQFAAHQKNA